MLDKPEKTRQLMATLEAALPFEVALMSDLIEHLARQQQPVAAAEARYCQASRNRLRSFCERIVSVSSRNVCVMCVAFIPRSPGVPPP